MGQMGDMSYVLLLRLVCRDLKNIVDNYEKVWNAFAGEQPLMYPTILGRIDDIIEHHLAKGVKINKRGGLELWGTNTCWCPDFSELLPPSPLDVATKFGVAMPMPRF